MDVSNRLLSHRSKDTVRIVSAPLAHDDGRAAAGEDQPESDALRSKDDAGIERADHEGTNGRGTLRGHLYGRPVAAGGQYDLDWFGRWVGARHARWRQNLGQSDATRPTGFHANQLDRSVAASERRCLPRRQSLSAGRSPTVHLQDR